MKRIKKLAQEFKAFITRGNVVDMAVAVIIGAAFGAIVTALTNGILQPLINYAIGGKDADLSALRTVLGTTYYTESGAIDWTLTNFIDWGDFIMKIINFLLIAFVLFVIIKIFMSLQSMRNGLIGADKKQMKKLAKERAKEKKISKEEALKELEAEKAAAEEEAAAAAAAEAAKPTTDELLTQIRDLLAAQNAKNEVKSDKAE